MAKDLVMMPRLYDTYGTLLTDRQRELFELYYHDDLSLSEISAEANITRQGALDAIGHAEAALLRFEEKLGLLRRIELIDAARKKVAEAAEALDVINRTGFRNPRAAGRIQELQDAVRELSQAVHE